MVNILIVIFILIVVVVVVRDRDNLDGIWVGGIIARSSSTYIKGERKEIDR